MPTGRVRVAPPATAAEAGQSPPPRDSPPSSSVVPASEFTITYSGRLAPDANLRIGATTITNGDEDEAGDTAARICRATWAVVRRFVPGADATVGVASS